MTTDVTEIINSISNALGIVYNKAVDLYPSVVKMNIVDNTFGLLLGIILSVIGYYCFWGYFKKWANKRRKDGWISADYDKYFDSHMALFIIGIFCALIGVTCICCAGCDLIEWIVAPEIKSIMWVQNLFK